MSRYTALPRRDWRLTAERYRDRLTAALRAPGGSQTLRPVQAGALPEIGLLKGGVVVGRVGVGKSAILSMAPLLARAQRPLFCFPGGSRKGIVDELGRIAQHWRQPAHVELKSYTEISNMPRKGQSLGDLFAGQGPDFIACDEAHALRNVGGRGRGGMGAGSALALQFQEWLEANPKCGFLVATATLDVDGIGDYWHLLDWALRQRSPVPRSAPEAKDWSDVLDAGDMTRAAVVACDLGMPADASLEELRAAFHDRVHATPGIIIEDTPFTGVPLTIAEHVLPTAPCAEPHFERLRDLWQRPDGLDVAQDADGDGAALEERQPDRVQDGSIWAIARRMGRGLCYVYDPLPPEPWRLARSAYYKWVRGALARGRWKTEAQARDWARDHAQPEWTAWHAVAAQYSHAGAGKTLWLSTAALDWAEQWGRAEPGIVWAEDPIWGRKLAERTGWRYFGERGRSSDGVHITDQRAEPGTRSAIASRRANGHALNLQYQWHRCLFVAVPGKSHDFEQAVGRFHREGQAEAVHVDLLFTCGEDFVARNKMIAGATRTAAQLYRQKAATNVWQHVEKPSHGAAWR